MARATGNEERGRTAAADSVCCCWRCQSSARTSSVSVFDALTSFRRTLISSSSLKEEMKSLQGLQLDGHSYGIASAMLSTARFNTPWNLSYMFLDFLPIRFIASRHCKLPTESSAIDIALTAWRFSLSVMTLDESPSVLHASRRPPWIWEDTSRKSLYVWHFFLSSASCSFLSRMSTSLPVVIGRLRGIFSGERVTLPPGSGRPAGKGCPLFALTMREGH